MNKYFFLIALLASTSCRFKNAEAEKPPSREQKTASAIDSLKKTALNGDLLVRLGDDMLSYQIKFLNQKEYEYSHAGVIVEREGKKWVVHIAPDDSTKGMIKYIPIDSFINTQKNLKCGLYRYDLTAKEQKAFTDTIEQYRKRDVRFDWLYDLSTNDRLYCSEMISKALLSSTQGRIQCPQMIPPRNTIAGLTNYFRGKLTREQIVNRKMISIDNLYLNPHCQFVMEVQLKYLAGQ